MVATGVESLDLAVRGEPGVLFVMAAGPASSRGILTPATGDLRRRREGAGRAEAREGVASGSGHGDLLVPDPSREAV